MTDGWLHRWEIDVSQRLDWRGALDGAFSFKSEFYYGITCNLSWLTYIPQTFAPDLTLEHKGQLASFPRRHSLAIFRG